MIIDDDAPKLRHQLLLALIPWLILALVFLPQLARADEPERFEAASRSPRQVVEDLAAQYFPPYLVGWAVSTARCETGGTFSLTAHSAGYDRRFAVWYEHIGPWQISGPTWSAKAWELFGGSLWEPDVGAQMAAWIAVNLGTSHWPVCGR